MSIQTKDYKSKKTGKTTIKYYACVFDPVTNSTIWGKGQSKRSEAIKDEAALLEDLEKGTPKGVGNMTFNEVADLWFVSMKKTYADATYRGYEWYYKKHLYPTFQDISVKKILPIHIQNFKNAMDEKYKPATVNKTLNLLSMIMSYAVKPLHITKSNPCEDIKRNKVDDPDHVTWDEKTISYFFSLDSVVNSDYYEMLVLSFTTALRPGEVCGLSVNALKGDNMIALTHGYNRYNNITDMKTRQSHRPLSLDPFVYTCLANRVEKKKLQKEQYMDKIKEAAKHGEPLGSMLYKENDFLFTYENGNPISPDCYSRAFRSIVRHHNAELKKIEEEKGKIPKNSYYLPVIRLYDGRHSFATNNIIGGKENAKVISEIMGSKVETIMKNYVHLKETMHQATLSKYSGKIFNIEDKKKSKNKNA